MTSAQLVPALVVPFVVWRIYRRVRRNIGRQHFRSGRMITAIVFFSIFTGLLALAALRSAATLEALGGGLLLGVPLAFAGLRLTRFEATPDGKFYTPNAIIGVILTLVLAGRIVYRLIGFAGGSAAPVPASAVAQNPLTMLLFGLTAGYYITYYAGALIRGRELAEPSA